MSNPSMDSLWPQLHLIGHELRTVPKGERPRRRTHDLHLFGLLLLGQGKYEVGPEAFPVERPVAWLLPEGEEEYIHIQGDTEGWWLSFHWPGLVGSELNSRALTLVSGQSNQSVPRVKLLDSADAARLVDLFQTLQQASSRVILSGELEKRSHLLRLLAFYMDLPDQIRQTAGHRAVRQFRELLETHAYEELRIEEIAAQIDMSPEHLRDLFFREFGVRPHEYRQAIRLTTARDRLCHSTMNVKEIARQVGFPDALYFSRVFKERYGINPSDMIRKYRR